MQREDVDYEEVIVRHSSSSEEDVLMLKELERAMFGDSKFLYVLFPSTFMGPDLVVIKNAVVPDSLTSYGLKNLKSGNFAEWDKNMFTCCIWNAYVSNSSQSNKLILKKSTDMNEESPFEGSERLINIRNEVRGENNFLDVLN